MSSPVSQPAMAVSPMVWKVLVRKLCCSMGNFEEDIVLSRWIQARTEEAKVFQHDRAQSFWKSKSHALSCLAVQGQGGGGPGLLPPWPWLLLSVGLSSPTFFHEYLLM